MKTIRVKYGTALCFMVTHLWLSPAESASDIHFLNAGVPIYSKPAVQHNLTPLAIEPYDTAAHAIKRNPAPYIAQAHDGIQIGIHRDCRNPTLENRRPRNIAIFTARNPDSPSHNEQPASSSPSSPWATTKKLLKDPSLKNTLGISLDSSSDNQPASPSPSSPWATTSPTSKKLLTNPSAKSSKCLTCKILCCRIACCSCRKKKRIAPIVYTPPLSIVVVKSAQARTTPEPSTASHTPDTSRDSTPASTPEPSSSGSAKGTRNGTSASF